MKKITVFLLQVVVSLTALASSNSVCGIPMGTPRDETKAILEERFGLLSVKERGGDLRIIDGKVGGIKYHILDFLFTWVKGVPRFNGADFQIIFGLNELREAKEVRENIVRIYSQKYEIEETIDNGFKCYYFGEDMQDGPDGRIWLSKGHGMDGKTRLYVIINYYGPYSETSDI